MFFKFTSKPSRIPKVILEKNCNETKKAQANNDWNEPCVFHEKTIKNIEMEASNIDKFKAQD